MKRCAFGEFSSQKGIKIDNFPDLQLTKGSEDFLVHDGILCMRLRGLDKYYVCEICGLQSILRSVF